MIGSAEAALLERLGILEALLHSRGLTLPRAHVEADFRGVCRFRDVVDTTVEVTDVGTTSLAYRAEIHRADRLCVEARVVVALCSADGEPTAWPEEWRRLLTSAGPQAPELLS
jgi:acyl-CoA thioester hydrolase